MSFADLLRQSVYSRLAGYEDVNDAEQLSRDPTFRLIGSEKTWDRGAALPSRLQTFESALMADEGNFAGLARVNRELIGKAEGIDSPHRTVLDMDSTEIPVYGQQEQSAYNGHFESSCYHPLLLFNRPTVWRPSCDRATCTVPRTGKNFSCRTSSGSKLGKEVVFRAGPPSPNQRMSWRSGR